MNNLQQNILLFRYVIAATIITLVSGTIFYHYVEKWSWLDSYYFCVVTLATVGYGDFVPKTIPGKIFTTFYIFAGVGIITAFISQLMQRWRHKMENRKTKQ
jgi:ABC-type microcin C transport system permease subunit YejB